MKYQFTNKQINDTFLTRYAKVIVKMGLNLKKGENLYIVTQIEGVNLAKKVMEEAYKVGARKVKFEIQDQSLTKVSYKMESRDSLKEIPTWYIDKFNSIVDENFCYLNILSEDPNIFSDIDASLLSELSVIRKKALKRFYDDTMFNNLRWCLCAIPNKAWAKEVFKEVSNDKQAERLLLEMILKTMKVNNKSYMKDWKEHFDLLEKRANYITQTNFKKFIYKNSLGTNFSISPIKDYYFASAREISPKKHIPFVANLPTEEIFGAPDKNSANGTVYSSLPLVHNGTIIEDFYLTFKDGKVIDFNAKKGYDTLKEIINADEGSAYLGEIAFVPYDNNIRKTGRLFFNTLFDENASCHLALGDSYPLVKGIDKMTQEEIKKYNLNKSTQHVDFMIGTKDLSIIGITQDDKEIAIFKDGNFVI